MEVMNIRKAERRIDIDIGSVFKKIDTGEKQWLRQLSRIWTSIRNNVGKNF
jgi:hypothetical protein